MSRGCAAVLVLLSLHLLPATAEAQCPPGQQRPGINARGWEENARVIINVHSNVFTDNKLNCIVAGPSRWNGTNGVVASPGLSSPTASLTIKCCMPTNFPGYDSPVVAGADIFYAQRSGSGHITDIEILTGPNWNFTIDVLDCESITKILAHEMGHAFGLGHTDPGTNHLMQEEAINGMGAMAGYPNDCEKQRAGEALTARLGLGGNPSPPDWACEREGLPGVSDNKNCCNRLNTFVYQADNLKPHGHITTLHNTVFPTGGSGTLSIHADDLDGHITRVGWYVDGALFYTSFSAPWSAPFSNAPAGDHIVQAAVYDTADVYVLTEPITIKVGSYFATDTLQTGQHLFPGYVLVAPNQSYYARLNSNGTFTLYTAAHVPIVSTTTTGTPLYVRMEENGNMVVRHQPFTTVFQTNTASFANGEGGLRVLNSGQIGIVRRSGTIAWNVP